MKLRMLLHDELVATLEAGREQLSTPASAIHAPTIERVSVALQSPPDLDILQTWLTDCLPENGAITPFVNRAREAHIRIAGLTNVAHPVGVLWGNTQAEYPGAIRFEREEHPDLGGEPDRYTMLTDTEIAERLNEAWRTATGTPRGAPERYPDRWISLSGARGKIGLFRDPQSSWGAASGTLLNTWIGKREQDPRLPGEAGIESICQRATALLGIPSARTMSRVFEDEQCVLSERSDRFLDPETGQVTARHQEEFAQACGWPGGLKYEKHDWPGTGAPTWEAAYEILRRLSSDPEASAGTLTRILAAAWTMGHVDLHRRNLGFTHGPLDKPKRVELAPVYDFSSGVGIKQRVTYQLAMSIAGQHAFEHIGPIQWIEHARRNNQDPADVIAIVDDVVRDTPEAVATARDSARDEDENIRQGAVDTRAEKLIASAEGTRNRWSQRRSGMRRKGARRLPNKTTQDQKDENPEWQGRW